jgi:hypothetical protein
LSKLRTPPQQPTKSISPNAKADDKNDCGRDLSTQIPLDPNSSENRCKCCHHKIPWWKTALDVGMFLATSGAFIAAAVYAGITHKMWKEMQEQSSIQRKVFTNTQRPLLGVDGRPIITKPVEIAGESGKRVARVETVMYVKNFGSQPAMHLGFNSRIFVPGNFETMDDYFKLLNVEADVACKMADLSTVNKKGPYLFPNNTHFELEDSSVQEGKKDDFTWQFKIIGCISYWDDISETIHHTRFCFKSGLNSPTGRIDTITSKDVLYACEENQTTD